MHQVRTLQPSNDEIRWEIPGLSYLDYILPSEVTFPRLFVYLLWETHTS